MKSFNFKQFSIKQDIAVFKIGTDAILLGAMCNCKEAEKILEVGTGTGIISLMLAQRNPNASITAIDIDPVAAELAKVNVAQSPFSYIQVEEIDYKQYSEEYKYDLIVSNPPYFQENSSSKNILARQQRALEYTSLIQKTVKHLTPSGIFSVIIPSDHLDDFIKIAKKVGFHLSKQINIKGIKGGCVKRVILELSFFPKDFRVEYFAVEEAPRKYSEEYLHLTKDFHLFNK